MLHLLLQTGNALLIEASPTDLIWGAGVSVQEIQDMQQPYCTTGQQRNIPGRNQLGIALIRIRNILREIVNHQHELQVTLAEKPHSKRHKKEQTLNFGKKLNRYYVKGIMQKHKLDILTRRAQY